MIFKIDSSLLNKYNGDHPSQLIASKKVPVSSFNVKSMGKILKERRWGKLGPIIGAMDNEMVTSCCRISIVGPPYWLTEPRLHKRQSSPIVRFVLATGAGCNLNNAGLIFYFYFLEWPLWRASRDLILPLYPIFIIIGVLWINFYQIMKIESKKKLWVFFVRYRNLSEMKNSENTFNVPSIARTFAQWERSSMKLHLGTKKCIFPVSGGAFEARIFRSMWCTRTDIWKGMRK